MKPYIHKVQYYETDRMGVTHHSNYIRWMEEARVQFLEEAGWGYDRLEEQGLMSPVIGVSSSHKETTTFHDEVRITVHIRKYNGVRLILGYEMYNNQTDRLVLTGTTEHCFMTRDFQLVRMKKAQPEFDALLRQLAEQE
ncbi:MAG: acyl-CoA thioesterase [Butyricicoccus sp.]